MQLIISNGQVDKVLD